MEITICQQVDMGFRDVGGGLGWGIKSFEPFDPEFLQQETAGRLSLHAAAS